MDFEMNVRRPALVPAGIDGLKFGNAIGVTALNTSQEGLADSALRGDSRVDSSCIAMPDLGKRVRNRSTAAGAYHPQQQAQWNPRLPLSDVASYLPYIDPIRTFGLLGSQGAGGLCEDGSRLPSIRACQSY